jgi:hypothetical protein
VKYLVTLKTVSWFRALWKSQISFRIIGHVYETERVGLAVTLLTRNPEVLASNFCQQIAVRSEVFHYSVFLQANAEVTPGWSPQSLLSIWFLGSRDRRDSSVGIATGYWLDGWRSIPGRGTIFLFPTESRPALGPTQPPIQCVQEAASSGVKQPGREADHSPSLTMIVREGNACKSLVEKPEGGEVSWET